MMVSVGCQTSLSDLYTLASDSTFPVGATIATCTATALGSDTRTDIVVGGADARARLDRPLPEAGGGRRAKCAIKIASRDSVDPWGGVGNSDHSDGHQDDGHDDHLDTPRGRC